MHFRLSLSLLLLGAAASFASPLVYPRDVASEFPDPSVDPFYAPPANLSKYTPGQVIRSRSVVTTITSGVGSSYQLLYRTTNTSNKAEGTVATVWAPKTPKSPAQILSYHSYMDSTSVSCSPSWAFVQGSASQGKSVTSLDAPIFIEWALNQGIYVVDPDDEGPKAAFIAGFQQGMSALDGVRATRNFYNLIKDHPGVALTGYSGGASVTAWAANLAGSYAPDLNILGAVHGGTPIDTRDTFNFLDGGLFSGFAGAGLVGLMNAYDDLNSYILAHVNAQGAAQIANYRSKDFCLNQVVTTYPFTNFLSEFSVADPLDQPIPKTVLGKETLLMSQSTVGVAVPKFPRFQWHALEDEIVPFADEQTFVTEQCQHGANIQFQIFPAAEHISAELLGIPGAILFLDQLFKGTTPKVICGTAVPNLPTLSSPEATTLLGADTVRSLLALNGTKTAFGQTITLPTL